MRRALTILAVLAVVGVAVVLTGATEDSPTGSTYKLEFDNAFGLVEGGDFRIGGVKAGQTTGLKLVEHKRGRPTAEVEATIQEPGFADLREDATCDVRPQSLIGEYFVDCQAGTSKRKLPTDGSGRIKLERTTSTIPTDLVNNVFREPYRERFRLILSTLGTGLAGRPQDVQAVLKRAHPGLRDTSRVLNVLAKQNKVIENFIVDADTTIEALEGNKTDVARWVEVSGRTAEITATRREALRQTFSKLPGLLDELTPTMASLEDLVDEQTPLLSDLERAAPSLTRFLTLLGPFAEASQPALKSLGEASEVGTRAFRRGSEEVKELRNLSKEAGPLAKPLRQFLQTMDDRRYAIDTDPRAKNAAPPAPDPTAIPGSGGFTGLEAIWNYPFWQTLSVNNRDSRGATLRLGLTADLDCSLLKTEIRTAADKNVFRKCGAFMGPYVPGITAPDFTDPGFQPAVKLDNKDGENKVTDAPVEQPTAQPKDGQPDAQPAPGTPDISRPQLKLPPELEKLLDGVKLPGSDKGVVPDVQERLETLLQPNQGQGQPQQPAPDRLLDFLLRP